MQRKLETEIRRQKDRANIFAASGDDDGRRAAQERINLLTNKYKDFSDAAGLPYKTERMSVAKFHRVKTAAELKRNQLTNVAHSGIVKSLDIDDFRIMASTKNVSTEAVDVISAVIRNYERAGGMYINDFYFGSLSSVDGGTPLLQIEPTADRTIRLNINTDIFSNTTLEEIDNMLANTKKNLANSLEEAVIHECSHAKSIYGKTIGEIEALYSELADQHIEEISTIAYKDGAECLAEIEILISRGADIPEEIMSFYNKYCGGRI